jgi:Na+/proline symporter
MNTTARATQVLGAISCVFCAAAAVWALFAWTKIHFVYDYHSLGWALALLFWFHLLTALGVLLAIVGLLLKQQRGRHLARTGCIANILSIIVFWILAIFSPV